METLTLGIVIAGLFTVGFVSGGIFGAGIYHFAKKQVESGAKAIAEAANKGAAVANVAAAAVDSATGKL